MKRVTLSEYCAQNSQTRVAEVLGVSRAAVSQMLESDREIYLDIVESDSGDEVVAWEKRPIPARRQVAAVA